ncbi:MAG: hypothetical protein JO356_07805 [Acidobacteria bacterium]|nr:hypothetical protein [Acidobacteriota bacterium]
MPNKPKVSKSSIRVVMATGAVGAALAMYSIEPLMARRGIQTEQASGVRASARDAAARTAFAAMLPVLRHPRCMNCHSRGDFPRQGDDRHRHTMDVRRGPEGDGLNAVKCRTCHQDHNLQGEHMPPGAPDWHLPSAAMPMIWEELTDRQLCELLNDPRQNGGRSLGEIVAHMSTPLVLWGWTPGEGRTPIAVPFSQFLAKVKEWAANGGACPGS